MGIEQGTPVRDFSAELSLQKDFIDLRLPRAFQAWTGFKFRHKPQIEVIGNLPLDEVATLADELSVSIAQAIGINTVDPTSRISQDKMIDLTSFISGEGNRIIFMRHGEQSPPEWVFSIPNPGLRKIRMMQNPFNKEDSLTNRGFVDVFTTAFGLLYLQKTSGRNLHILSSENTRAREVADVISSVVPGSTLLMREGLNSITYKDERDEPPISVEDILHELPSGFMPWEPPLVDKLCKGTRSGVKQSVAIVDTIGDLVTEGTKEEGNNLYVVLTHSQQLAEVLRLTGTLQDDSTRVPEMSMIVINAPGQRCILPRGVLAEKRVYPKSRNMRKTLERLGDGYEWYKIRRSEYETDQKMPFLVAPEPLYLSKDEAKEILRIGQDTTDFIYAADELYRQESDLRQLLDRGKPGIFQKDREARYLFVRPDLLMTDQGFSICEIETSPFGLALAELLNRAYRAAGFNTMVNNGVLQEFFAKNTPFQGTIVYSEKTSSYAGQLQFLAREMFSGEDRAWNAEQADFALGNNRQSVYRGFYQHEYLTDMFINGLVQKLLEDGDDTALPSFTPHMEEKALLTLIWDKRWEPFLAKQLGGASLKHLREVVPPTWVVGQEQFFIPGLPQGMSSSEGLAGLSRAKRRFVLKKSGFGSGSSWAEGVNFLQEKSADRVRAMLFVASQDDQSLYVIQEFRSSQERPMFFDKDAHTVEQMKARIRLTPYFSMIAGDEAKLVAIKATGCENTNYIHASTGSINTAVAQI